MSGKPGKYISIDSGPIEERSPSISIVKIFFFPFIDIKFKHWGFGQRKSSNDEGKYCRHNINFAITCLRNLFCYLLLANPAELHISISTKYSSTLLQLTPQKLPHFW